jgi:hypothetical protein
VSAPITTTNWKIARVVLAATIIDGFCAAFFHFVVTTGDASKFFHLSWLYMHTPVVDWASELLLSNVSNFHAPISPVVWMQYYFACVCQTALLAFVGSAIYFRRKAISDNNGANRDLESHRQ